MTKTYTPAIGHIIIVHDAVSAYHGREAVVTSINTDYGVTVYNVRAGNVCMSLTRDKLRELKYEG